MAILFTQGTLNPASGTQARDIRQTFANALIGNPNWTLIENYNSATWETTVVQNSNGFVVAFANSTTLTDMRIVISLGTSYTLATHTINNMAFVNSLQGVAQAGGFSGYTYQPSTGVGVASQWFGYQNIILASTGQTAWTAHIEDNHAILSYKDGTSENATWKYIGYAESMVKNINITDTYPVFIGGRNTQSYSYTYPVAFLTSVGNEGQNINHGGKHTAQQSIPVAMLSYADKYSANPTLGSVSNIFIYRAGWNDDYLDTTSAANGKIRAKLYNTVYAPATGAAYGDTVTIGTKTYMYIGGTSNHTPANSLALVAAWAAIN